VAALPDQQVSGGNLVYVLEDGAGRRNITEREVVAQPLHADTPLDAGILEEGLDLGGEDQALPVDVVIERLLPGAVSCQDQAALGLVQSAKANMPRSRFTHSRPKSS